MGIEALEKNKGQTLCANILTIGDGSISNERN